MLRKYAAAQVLAVAPAEGLRAQAHRAVFSFVPRAGYLYVRSRSISSRCNDNYDYFGPEEIAKSYRTFIGKPVFVNHANHDHRRARGMVIDAVLHRDRNPDGSPDTWVETLMEVDAQSYPRLAKAILNGDVDRTSMGCDVELSKCSVCGNEATSPLEYCQHIPGQKGKRIYRMAANGRREGVLVFEVCSGLKFFENSLLVEQPADPTAFFLGQPVVGPGLEHLHAKAASLRAVIEEAPKLQRTAAAGDDWSVGMSEERRRKAEEAGSKLWEGMHQIFDPGSNAESRKSDRNSKVMNALQNNGYQPHHIRFNENDDDHPYAHIEGRGGWYAQDHSGPHLEIRHHATGDESHDLINLQHHDPQTGSQHRVPGYGPHEAEQDLHHWTDGDPEETGGAAQYLEQNDPRIKRWQQRHQSALEVEAASKVKSATQAEAESYLADHPIGVHHILDRVKTAATNPATLHSGMKWYDDAHGMAKTMAAHHKVPLQHVAGALGVYSASSAPAPNYHMASLALHAGRGIYSGRDKETKEFTGDRGTGGHGGLAEHEYDYRGDPMASAADAHKVDRILSGEHYNDVIGSSKTKSYARLIHNPNNAHDVVIDRHAVAAAVGHVGNSGDPYNKVAGPIENANKKGEGKIYDRVADAYREATHHVNTSPEFSKLRTQMRKSGLLEKGEKVKPHHVQALAWIVQKQVSDAHGHDMTDANQKNIDAWQNHYTSRYGNDAHQPVSGAGFYGQEPSSSGSEKAASLRPRWAYGETVAPQDVDTLRDERCAICGNDTAYDGRECLVCGYLAPPKALGDPDVDKAKRLDELKQSVDDALLDVDPSRQGADFDPGDVDAIQAEQLEEVGPSTLGCPACGSEFPSAPPTSEDALSGEEQESPAEGDPCPACGKGILESTGQSEDVGAAEALDEDGEPGDEQDAAEDEAEGGLPGEQDPDDPDAVDVDSDDDEDEDEADKKKRPAVKRAATSKYQHPLKGIEMQKALAALAELQALVEYQQHENRKLSARLAVKDSQIQRLTYGLQAIAQHLGPEVDTLVRTAMLHKRADEQNPAQPVPEPAPEPATQSTPEVETPEAMADVNQPGMVPGSTQDVAADAVTTAYTPGQDIGAPPIRQLVDVTRPIDGTQGPRPLSETKTNVDVRVGNPMNPQTAFPLAGPFAQPARTGSTNGDAHAMAAIRLARLRIATGEQGDDLALAQRIASEMDPAAINAEIATLNGVLKRTASRQAGRDGAQPPRGAVPRAAPGVGRTTPSLTSQAGLRTHSVQRDDDSDLALLFLGDGALSN